MENQYKKNREYWQLCEQMESSLLPAQIRWNTYLKEYCLLEHIFLQPLVYTAANKTNKKIYLKSTLKERTCK